MFTRSIFRQATNATSRFAMTTTSSLSSSRIFISAATVTPRGIRFFSNLLTEGGPALTYSSEKPVVKYTEDHEWIALHKDNVAFIGITKYAADALGDATYIEVAEIGEEVEPNGSIGSVESVKSASDLYTPVAGEIVDRNEDIISNPTIVNEDPLGKGWFAKLKVATPEEVDGLMDIEAYEEFIKSD